MKRLLALLLVLTVAFCAPAAAETARRPLASGDTGDAVVELQKRLQSLGLSTGEADGIYGKQTAAGVTEAQRLLAAAGYDVAQTGEADADTLKLLFDPEAEATLYPAAGQPGRPRAPAAKPADRLKAPLR